TLAYRGLDDAVRSTVLTFEPPPERFGAGFARHRVSLAPGQAVEMRLTVTAADGSEPGSAAVTAIDRPGARLTGPVRVFTASASFDEWLARSWADLRMLATETAQGRVTYAGIPWFVAPFGRDSIITALQHLPFDPELARGTLRFLAAHQGREDDEF